MGVRWERRLFSFRKGDRINALCFRVFYFILIRNPIKIKFLSLCISCRKTTFSTESDEYNTSSQCRGNFFVSLQERAGSILRGCAAFCREALLWKERPLTSV